MLAGLEQFQQPSHLPELLQVEGGRGRRLSRGLLPVFGGGGPVQPQLAGQGLKLLENQAAIRQMLANPETQKLLRSLQKKNAGQLKSAAQSALQGDTAALTQVLNELAADPQAKQAMEQLDQTLNK